MLLVSFASLAQKKCNVCTGPLPQMLTANSPLPRCSVVPVRHLRLWSLTVNCGKVTNHNICDFLWSTESNNISNCRNLFFGVFRPEKRQKLVKTRKKPLNHRNSRTQGGSHGNHFGLSVGITTKMVRTCQKRKTNIFIYIPA